VDLAIWAAVVFVVLLAVLYKYAFGPLVTTVDRREDRVAAEIAEAQEQHDRAVELIKQHEAKLAGVKEEVRALLEEARRDAQHTHEEILAEAREAAQAEQQRVLREVRNAKDAALKEIGEASADFAIQLAAEIVRKELDATQHNRLIRDSLQKFPSEN